MGNMPFNIPLSAGASVGLSTVAAMASPCGHVLQWLAILVLVQQTLWPSSICQNRKLFRMRSGETVRLICETETGFGKSNAAFG